VDWTYKHFNQAAVFGAPRERVLEAARAVAADAFGSLEDTADGFVARGGRGWHVTSAAFRLTPAAEGTRLAVELLAQRAAMRGYMLVDVGGYYDGQIDKWFSAIAQRLGGAPEQILVSKTTASLKVRRGCFAGCLVYLVVGACLAFLAIPLDHALFSQAAGSGPGPLSLAASSIGLLIGIAAFLLVIYPDAPASKAIRARLPGSRN